MRGFPLGWGTVVVGDRCDGLLQTRGLKLPLRPSLSPGGPPAKVKQGQDAGVGRAPCPLQHLAPPWTPSPQVLHLWQVAVPQ